MTEPTSASGIAALGIDAKAIIFQIINFVALLLILKWVAYKPILKVLDERREKIEHSLKAAKEMAEKEARWKQEMEHLREKNNQEAQKILREAQTAAKKEAEEIIAKATEQQKAIVEKSQKQITQQKEKMISQAKKELGDLVVAATEKILKEKIDAKKNDALIREALK